MGALFRSQEMALCQLFLQAESAYACAAELGELGLAQFRDLNPNVNAFQRKFVSEVRRCDEMERKLRFIEKEIKKAKLPIGEPLEIPEAPQPREVIDLEATFERLEAELNEINANADALNRNFLELTELKHILRKTQTFFEEAMHEGGGLTETEAPAAVEEGAAGGPAQATQTLHLGFLAGVILRERLPAFERMLWRACRGNVFLRRADIETPLEDPSTGDLYYKAVFIVFFQGDQLKSRVKKICEGFHATLYPCPESPAERREMAIGVMTRLEDLSTVLKQTEEHRRRALENAARNLVMWLVKVRKIKAIYHTLNLFNLDVTNKCLIGECWLPVDDLESSQNALTRGTEKSGGSVPSIINRVATHEEPPTYNKLNKFTQGFQNLVDSYGIGRYREVNPTPYNVITFPFLFAVMFGDAGHGLLMFLFALWMVLSEKKLGAQRGMNEIFETFFYGRYIVLLMGLFSIYTGILYNDFFGRAINLFGSGWRVYSISYSTINSSISGDTTNSLDPNSSDFSRAYPYGIDPIWNIAENSITFTNSLKMKLSIILGVTQMLFGVGLSYINHRFYGKPINIFCEFIPQVLFLSCMFGYLVVLIFVKWIAFAPSESNTAPSLLIGLINMFLMRYSCDSSTSQAYCVWYPGQTTIQIILVLICVLCVPWMLVIKPTIRIYQLRKQQHLQEDERHIMGSTASLSEAVNSSGAEGDGATGQVAMKDLRDGRRSGNSTPMSSSSASDGRAGAHGGGGESHGDSHEGDNTVDIIVLQSIHTIEYCLGTISNTASYLRLWALSLAHSQLSDVLWTMVLRGLGFQMFGASWAGFISTFIFFVPWAGLTVGILIAMEGLSAFLHALRLHWVEFQSKFYSGTGYKFTPFAFQEMVEETMKALD